MKQFLQEVQKHQIRDTPEFKLLFAIIKQAHLDLNNPAYAIDAKKFFESGIYDYIKILNSEIGTK
jgi:hypothetical protein